MSLSEIAFDPSDMRTMCLAWGEELTAWHLDEHGEHEDEIIERQLLVIVMIALSVHHAAREKQLSPADLGALPISVAAAPLADETLASHLIRSTVELPVGRGAEQLVDLRRLFGHDANQWGRVVYLARRVLVDRLRAAAVTVEGVGGRSATLGSLRPAIELRHPEYQPLQF